MPVNRILFEREIGKLGKELLGQAGAHDEPQRTRWHVEHQHLVQLVADALGRDNGEPAVHALHRRDERGVRFQVEAGREAGGAQHAQRVVPEGDLGIEWGAQAPRGQVAEPVEGVDELHVGQAEGQRVDREVAARQVHDDVVAEGHLGLARLGDVDLGPVGRDLVHLAVLAKADRPEARTLGPHLVGPAPHQTLRLVGAGVGGEIEVRRATRLAGEQRVTHGTADQVQRAARRREATREVLGGMHIGAEPFGHRGGLHPPTVVRPLASPCVDALGQDRPLHARRDHRRPCRQPRRGWPGAARRYRRTR